MRQLLLSLIALLSCSSLIAMDGAKELITEMPKKIIDSTVGHEEAKESFEKKSVELEKALGSENGQCEAYRRYGKIPDCESILLSVAQLMAGFAGARREYEEATEKEKEGTENRLIILTELVEAYKKDSSNPKTWSDYAAARKEYDEFRLEKLQVRKAKLVALNAKLAEVHKIHEIIESMFGDIHDKLSLLNSKK